MKIEPIRFISYKGMNLQDKKINNENAQINPICDNTLRLYNNKFKNDFLISKNLGFTGVNKAAANFELKGVYDLNCPCCGEKMMTDKQIRVFKQSIQGRKGAGLEDILSQYQEYLRPTEASVAQTIISDAWQFPDLGLKQIVEFESKKSKKKLDVKQMGSIAKMRNMSKNASKDSRKAIHTVLDNAMQKIKQSTDEDHFKLSGFIDELKSIKHPARDNSCFEDLLEVATDMPNSHTSEDAFFVKYARKKEHEIAERLVSPSQITTEHIKPQSKDGENRRSNFIPLCEACNSTRGDMPYKKWIRLHPEMPENFQKFINTIYQKIENGEIKESGWEDYIDDIIRTFAKETDEQVVLTKPNGKPVNLEEDESYEEKELTIDKLREKWLKQYEEYNAKLAELKQIKNRKKKYKKGKKSSIGKQQKISCNKPKSA